LRAVIERSRRPGPKRCDTSSDSVRPREWFQPSVPEFTLARGAWMLPQSDAPSSQRCAA
jgi:hypothetical protein